MHASAHIIARFAVVSIATVSAAFAEAQTLVITRGGSRLVRPAPAENFTGSARVEMLIEAVDPSHASGGTVTFEPGSRTAALTDDVLYGAVWRRPDLSPRDRSLVTIAALAAIGDDDHLDAYVRRGLDSGLTRTEIAEAVTHLGFYAGWSKASRAMMAITKSFGE